MTTQKSKFKEAQEKARRLWDVVLKPHSGTSLIKRIQTEKLRRAGNNGIDYE